MKKLASILVVCLLAVFVYLKDGTVIKANKIVSAGNNAIIVEKEFSKIYIPNDVIKYVEVK